MLPARGRDGLRKAGRKTGRRGARSFWREFLSLAGVAVLATLVIQLFFARIYVVPSASMERTLHGCEGCLDDRIVADKVVYRFGSPQPGDVVVFRGPPAWSTSEQTRARPTSWVAGLFDDTLSLLGSESGSGETFVKRVIAVGGQTVACCDASNRVTVDGKPLNERYLYYQPDRGPAVQEGFAPQKVPLGMLWVMGDNRNNSADARVHGPIPVDDVVGKARLVLFPLNRFTTIPNLDPQR